RTAPATRLKRPLLMAASAVLLCIGIVALSSVWSKASPTVESKSPLPTHSATALPMTLAAATLAQRTILTTSAIASHTHTPSATSTPTPSDPATVVAIVTAHDTISAIGSFTNTSTRTSTSTATPTATLRPVFPNTPTALPGASRVDAEGVVLLWTPAG